MKTKTDYEVEGCWTGLKIITNCRVCGTLLTPTPKTGHYNSKYWELQRHNKEQLVSCPNNCAEALAVKTIRDFLAVRGYCTEKSKSWYYKLDYTIIKHAWVNRKGKVYPVGIREHVYFAQDRGTTEHDLELKGWLKLSNRDLYWEKELSKKQIDFAFDYLVANNCENKTKEFMEKSEYACCYFKLGKI